MLLSFLLLYVELDYLIVDPANGKGVKRGVYPRSPRPPPPPLPPALALLTVARPLARPTPRPRAFRLLNIGAFLSPRQQVVVYGVAGTGRLPQHIRNNEEAHVAAANVDLFQMADSAVACRHGDIFELHVHVVLGCDRGEKLLATRLLPGPM